jgi:hypothetical protein
VKVGDLVVNTTSCRNNSTKFNTGIIIKLGHMTRYGRFTTVAWFSSDKSIVLEKDLRRLNENR